jgi:type II secretion system protein C
VLELSLKALQVMLGLGALALAGTTVASFSSSSAPVAATPPIDATLPSELDPSASLPRYGVIAARNLFKLKEKPVAAPTEEPIVESKLQVQLLGTLVQGGPVDAPVTAEPPRQTSIAIVRDTNGDVVTLAIGDKFAEERAQLVKVEPRRIVLEHQGKLEAVLLDEEGATKAAAARPAPPVPPGGTLAQLSPNMVQDVARRMTQAMGPDAAMLALFRQLQPFMIGSVERDANGRLLGYRVERVNEGSPLQAIGLQQGDSIRAINGQAIGADGAQTRVFTALMGGDAKLTVQDKDGRPRDLVLPRAVLEKLVMLR